MKYLCIVSNSPGHIDFGGMGFIKVAKEIKKNNTVEWITSSPTMKSTLKYLGEDVKLVLGIEGLKVQNYINTLDSTVENLLCSSIDLIFKYCKYYQPSIILLDRALNIAPVIATALNIPYISVGTPGGKWDMDNIGKLPSIPSEHSFFSFAEKYLQKLNWFTCVPKSIWIDSPYLNICFVGKSFYPEVVEPEGSTAYVHHFDEYFIPPQNSRNIGFSFGNTDSLLQIDEFTTILQSIQQYSTTKIDIFTGNNSQLHQALINKLQNGFDIHSWVDFKKSFLHLKGIIYFGGIGTTWHSLNTSTPMCVIPRIGDQLYNGKQIERLGLGICLKKDLSNLNHFLRLIERPSTKVQESINSFKELDNYTHNVKTVAESISKISSFGS